MRYFTILFFLICLKPLIIEKEAPLRISVSKSQLKDKIRGGWAGQMIGVSFANTRSYSTLNSLCALHKGFISETLQQKPDAYDDVFMDIAFLEALEKKGFDCRSNVLGKTYTDAKFVFSHANQVSRSNILHGVKPPLTGHWTNNPHADDADFQLEADFIGLTSPAMPAAALKVADRVGHITTYGDGFYGGVYVANLYSLAFRYHKLDRIVSEAIKSIPKRTRFYDCVSDAIELNLKYPSDWKRAKAELLKRWGTEIRCPEDDAEKRPDAKLSAAFLTLSLLYSKNNFSHAMEIAANLCHHSDNHVAATAGILGTLIGYSKIPDAWKEGIVQVEDRDFEGTTLSLKEACDISFKHALKNIERYGGKIKNKEVDINLQEPVEAKTERSFEGHNLAEHRSLENTIITHELEFDFEGIGFLLRGDATSQKESSDHVFETDVYIDNKLVETAYIPASLTKHADLVWKYQLPYGKHNVRLVLLNPSEEYQLRAADLMVYDVREVVLTHK